MRWRAILVVLFVWPALAGCIGGTADDGQPDDAEAAASAVEPASLEAAVTNTTAVNRSEVEDSLNETIPPPPDPCAQPVHGLDHPCIADGLNVGEAVYWGGGPMPDWRSSAAGADYVLGGSRCADTTDCTEFSFGVAEAPSGARLRVDVSLYFADPSYVRTGIVDSLVWTPETALLLQLYAPGALEADEPEASATADSTGMFAQSVFVGGYEAGSDAPLAPPAPGTWTVRLSGAPPSDLHVRLRAALQVVEPPSDELAFPDLRIIAPFEVGFHVPTSSFQPGVATGVAAPATTCMAEEYVEAQEEGLDRPTLCLRFSMGFYNAGDGALRLRAVRDAGDPVQGARVEAGVDDVPLVQNVCTADGRLCTDVPELTDANTRYHQSHLHYHYQNAYVFDLYRVEDETHGSAPTLVHVSTSGKLGINPGSEAMEGWDDRFDQPTPRAPAGTDRDGNPSPTSQRLQAGWGDVYDWNRGGNYIDFPVDPEMRPVPGEYVLRGVTDPDGQIVETNETNNVAYTYFRVSGLGEVTTTERGYGTDPWDPDRHVFEVTP